MGYSLGACNAYRHAVVAGLFFTGGGAAWFVLAIFVKEVKPGVRRERRGR